MNQPGFFFRFTKGQQRGVFALFFVIILLQAGYFVIQSFDFKGDKAASEEEREWLSHQAEIDRLKALHRKKERMIYPFNPNFISDYKGYTLGMTVEEIDRLHEFRKDNQYVNNASEFQQVTKISDSLLSVVSPYFKFPDWVDEKGNKRYTDAVKYVNTKGLHNSEFPAKEEKIIVADINEALEEDLIKLYGIGPAFAKKILRRRAQFGGFVSMDQMDDFPEFSPQAQQELRKYFAVSGNPDVNKININTASLNQLSYFPYFDKSLAKAIITRRSMKGKISKFEELTEINGFPVDKEKIIALYLEF